MPSLAQRQACRFSSCSTKLSGLVRVQSSSSPWLLLPASCAWFHRRHGNRDFAGHLRVIEECLAIICLQRCIRSSECRRMHTSCLVVWLQLWDVCTWGLLLHSTAWSPQALSCSTSHTRSLSPVCCSGVAIPSSMAHSGFVASVSSRTSSCCPGRSLPLSCIHSQPRCQRRQAVSQTFYSSAAACKS